MLVSLCGVPGSGKTSVGRLLRERGYNVVDLSRLIDELGIGADWDDEAKSRLVDRAELGSALWTWWTETEKEDEIWILEGHLSHLAPSDMVLLLRVDPDEIMDRLKDRGYSEGKSRENAEAEGISLLVYEALEVEKEALGGEDWKLLPRRAGIVFERDITELDPAETADWVNEMLEAYRGKRFYLLSRYRPGRVDWTEVLAGWF